MEIKVTSQQKDDKNDLDTFTSNMYKANNQNIIGFPCINGTPPLAEKLESIYGLVLARPKDPIKSLNNDPIKFYHYKDSPQNTKDKMNFIELNKPTFQYFIIISVF